MDILKAIPYNSFFELLINNDYSKQWLQKASLRYVEELWLEWHNKRLRQYEGALDTNILEEVEELGVTRIVDWELLVFHYDMKLS